jgi:hypothetical protein
MAVIDLFHYPLVCDDEILTQYGSRYYGKTEARKRLVAWALSTVGRPLSSISLRFEPSQLICANEVFPEAALADPIADLEVWDEWRTGLRRFPHPGIYSRLEIRRQETKTSATSSIGVLGEIFTGLLAQSFIAPTVTVRPIHRWPDFILFKTDDKYAFVESKASVRLDEDIEAGIRGVSHELLGEGLVDAVQELNAEPRVIVWLSFTQIINIDPLHAQVIMVEVTAPEARQSASLLQLPAAVSEGLKERAIDMTAAAVETDEPELFDRLEKEQNRESVKKISSSIQQKVHDSLRQVLKSEVPENLYDKSFADISKRISLWRPPAQKINVISGRRLRLAKQAATEGRLSAIRGTPDSDDRLYIADIPAELIKTLRNQWQPDWAHASNPWGHIEGIPLWRCSSAILASGSLKLEKGNIRNIDHHQYKV